MDDISQQLLAALRDQIGVLGKYNNQDFELIEVIEHEPAVVLQDCSTKHTAIQDDMYGEAHRFVNETHTVPILSEVNSTLHPVLAEFLPAKIVKHLNSLINQG